MCLLNMANLRVWVILLIRGGGLAPTLKKNYRVGGLGSFQVVCLIYKKSTFRQTVL